MTLSQRLLATILMCGAFIAPATAQSFALPPNDGFITDAIGLLSPGEEELIEARLDAYSKETSNEIAVLIVASMSGADIASTGVEVLRTWGIGQEDKNNGVLIHIAYQDRKIWITTGYGMEGPLPDIVVKGII